MESRSIRRSLQLGSILSDYFVFNTRVLSCLGLGLILFVSQSRVAVAIDKTKTTESVDPKQVLPEADQMGFKERLEAAVADDSVKAFNDSIDWNAILDKSIDGVKSTALDNIRKDFKKGFLSNLNADASFAAQIIRTVKLGGTYKFLRLDEIDGEPIAIFRLKHANQGGVNYFQFFLKRSADGLVRANDFYVFASAERISDTIRRIWLPLVAESTKNLVQRFTQAPDPLIGSILKITEMQKLVRDGQPDKALELFRSLPEKAQHEKVFLLLRLGAAQAVSDEEHSEAIEDFRKYHPNDAALDFLLIDGYVLKKKLEQALECIDRTNKSVGGDSCLLAMRGSVLAQLKRFDEAKTVMEKVIKLEPDLRDNYFVAIEVSLVAKNYEDTVKYINATESVFNVKFGNLTEIPVYADFVKSPEYEKWVESRN